MNCIKCNKKISSQSKYCPFCGSACRGQLDTQTLVSSTLVEKAEEPFTYAGFWIRFAAYVIDLIGLFSAAFLLGILFALFGLSATIDIIPEIAWNYLSYVVYTVIVLSLWSTSLGKYAFGLEVRNADNRKLTSIEALKRSLLQPVSTLFFGSGYWGVAKGIRHQAWHDTATQTFVIQRKKNLVFAYLLTCVALILWAFMYLAYSS